jgi:hypothetical protein
MTPEREECVVRRIDALPLLEEQTGGEKPERHAVAAVPEREQMTRILPVRSDIR